MRFLSPEWLILVPILIFIGWRWPRLGLRLPRRVICLSLLVFLLIQPEIRQTGKGLDLWVLVDRSASAQETMSQQLSEWEGLLERSKGKDDRMTFVDFADQPVLRDQMDQSIGFEGNREHTRLNLAAQFALTRLSKDRAARLLVLTDGFSTEPLSGLEGHLRTHQVALDYRLTGADISGDTRIDALVIPGRTQIAEPFLIEVRVSGDGDGEVPLEIYRGATPVMRGKIALQGGRGLARFSDRINEPGAYEYTALIRPDHDMIMQNNRISAWVEIISGPRILLVTTYEDDPLAAVLRQQGFEVETVDQPGSLTMGNLSGAKLVIFNNIPAYRVPSDFLAAIPFFVNEQGGGLLMTGGKYSFGSGGYFQSPLDPLLPVSMELRQEHRKLAVAMAIVMDRSGSMSATVSGAKPGTTKMDLANEGAARAVQLLGDNDAVTVFAVDSKAHEFVPLSIVGSNRSKIDDGIRRIVSMGGGIFIYEGLSAAWKELKKAEQGQKHIILFTDAMDSEEPGDYQKLLAEMTKAGATLSVIGLGTEKDTDAELLKDIARLGNGRIFFNDDAGDLPALFAQETVAVARSTFIDEAVGTTPTAGWLELSARPMDWMPSVDGYNLSYLQPQATAALNSKDEYAAPLVAFWQRGLGRSAAVSFPMGGLYSQRVRQWKGYGDFVQTLSRWLMGPPVPSGLALRSRISGEDLEIELLHDASREEELLLRPPQIALSSGQGNMIKPAWEKVAPGRFFTSVKLQPSQVIRGAVQAGSYVLPFGPVMLGRNEEWAFDRSRVVELQAVAAASGGGERVDMGSIWQSPRREEFRDIKEGLLILFLLAFLVDAFLTRTGLTPQELMAWAGFKSKKSAPTQ